MSTIEAALQMALDAFELTSDAFEAKYYPEAGPQNIINTIRAAIERESRRDAALAEHRRQGDEMELEILKLTAERDQLRSALRECVGALDEIIDLVAAARDGEYEFDSLSAQPCREALTSARKALGEMEDEDC